MSYPNSPALVEAKVNEQMEKFLLRTNTTQRQLLSKFDPKIVLSELVFLQKFKKPKKIMIPGYSTSIILNSESPAVKTLKETPIENKFKRSNLSPCPTTVKFDTPVKIYPNLSSREAILSPTSPTDKLLSLYKDLVDSIKSTKKTKRFRISKTERKVKTLHKEIKVISEGKNNFDVNSSIKNNYERKFRKESIKELVKNKRTDSQYEYTVNKYALTNRKKNKFKSIY